MTLHIVPKTAPPEKRKLKSAAASKPADMLECPSCGGREITETVIGAVRAGGKIKGGTKQFVCVCCLLQGRRVVVA